MHISFFGIRAPGVPNGRFQKSNKHERSTPSGPSPSLWPETVHLPPTAVRRASPNIASDTLVHSAATCATESAISNLEERVHAQSTTSSTETNKTRVRSDSTFLSSRSTTESIVKPIDSSITNVFEPHYPKWHSYPPILPSQFDSGISSSLIKGEPLNLTEAFLCQSNALQDWIEKKNQERIQLRQRPEYQCLVESLHKYKRLANQEPTPALRADAKQHILQIEREMLMERQTFAKDELQQIRDIENAWVAFANICNYEKQISKQRHLSSLPRVEPKCTLSRVERLLGSDGSSHCNPRDSTWTRPPSTASQTSPFKMSYEEAAAEAMADSLDPSKAPNERPAKIPERLPPMLAPVQPMPDKPFEILIPDWFSVAEYQGNLEMTGDTIEERWANLLNFIHDLEVGKRNIEYKKEHPDAEGVVPDQQWDKHWHEPNPGWRHEHQRRNGGLWKCRKDFTATAAEKKCRLCSDIPPREEIHPGEVLDLVMKYIREAMAVVAEDDKEEVEVQAAKRDYKPFNPEQFLMDIEENVKRLQALQVDNPNTVRETILSGGSRSWINHNPLRGHDGSTEAAARARDHTQLATIKEHEQEQERVDDGEATKGKQASMSDTGGDKARP
ncbi:hypothetical protein F5Y19DRAFT_87411 [Xylariaceae sp. FL1651]|nr:hypothetical protein F5Y19DRAFT_87411 [Xylariaceae sp. FL1651]